MFEFLELNFFKHEGPKIVDSTISERGGRFDSVSRKVGRFQLDHQTM